MKVFNIKKYNGVSFSLVGKKELYCFFVEFCINNGFDRRFFVESFNFSTKKFIFYSHSRQVEGVRFFDGKPSFINVTENIKTNGIFQIRCGDGFVIDYDEFSENLNKRLSNIKKKKTKKRKRVDCSTASYRRRIKKKYRACRCESKREHGDFITSMESGVKIRRRQFSKVSMVKRYCMEDFISKRKEERSWKTQKKLSQWQKNT